MANLKSAKKRAIQNKKRNLKNQARQSELKTITKKYLEAVDANDVVTAQQLLKLSESKIARARGKGLLKKNSTARKISRLAKKLAPKK